MASAMSCRPSCRAARLSSHAASRSAPGPTVSSVIGRSKSWASAGRPVSISSRARSFDAPAGVSTARRSARSRSSSRSRNSRSRPRSPPYRARPRTRRPSAGPPRTARRDSTSSAASRRALWSRPTARASLPSSSSSVRFVASCLGLTRRAASMRRPAQHQSVLSRQRRTQRVEILGVEPGGGRVRVHRERLVEAALAQRGRHPVLSRAAIARPAGIRPPVGPAGPFPGSPPPSPQTDRRDHGQERRPAENEGQDPRSQRWCCRHQTSVQELHDSGTAGRSAHCTLPRTHGSSHLSCGRC